ncbi:glycosyltransferase family 9 protein [Silvanigrella sp.]|uniref:glycosyltransferase family 9 protein n=1 Tax=Silvanigrella sp. TaxID=2024976 RepID=UPI0037CAD84C|nr:glycosyltransferase family 9 protein [Silvanigrellaceae bacterium]
MTSANPEKILIMLPRQLGDVLLATPLASVLKQKYPTAQIDWWAHPMAKEILSGNPYLNKVHYLPIWRKKEYKNVFFLKKFWHWLLYLWSEITLFFYIRKQKYNIIIDAINYPRSSFQTLFAGANIRISFKCNSIRDITYTHLVHRDKLDTGYLGFTRLYLLEPLGIYMDKINLEEVKIDLPIEEINKVKPSKWIAEQLDQLQVHNYIVMSPTSRYLVRCWPIPSYTDLALELAKKYNIATVWSRAPGEEEYILKVHQNFKEKLKQNSLNENMSLLPPLMSIREIAFLTKNSIGCVANSNGMSHIAVASGAKMIQLHGPTQPVNWCPPNKLKYQSLQRNVGCVGCSSNSCKLMHRECLDELSVHEVFIAIEELFLKK